MPFWTTQNRIGATETVSNVSVIIVVVFTRKHTAFGRVVFLKSRKGFSACARARSDGCDNGGGTGLNRKEILFTITCLYDSYFHRYYCGRYTLHCKRLCIFCVRRFAPNKTGQLTASDPVTGQSAAGIKSVAEGGGRGVGEGGGGGGSGRALISNCPNVIKRKSLGARICNFQIGL